MWSVRVATDYALQYTCQRALGMEIARGLARADAADKFTAVQKPGLETHLHPPLGSTRGLARADAAASAPHSLF